MTRKHEARGRGSGPAQRTMTRKQQIDAALKLLAPPADKIEQCHTHILKWLDRITALTKPKPEFDFDIVFWLGRPPRPQLPSYVAALGAYELLKFWGHNPTTTDDGEWDQLAVILFGKRGADLHRQILKVRSEVTTDRAMPEIGRRGRSGGVVSRHFDDLDAVLEFDTLDNLWQLVFSL